MSPDQEDIETITVTKVEDLLSHLNAPQHYSVNPLFRGHRDESWKLEPQLFRLRRMPVTTFYKWKILEQELLWEFRRRAVGVDPTLRGLDNDIDWIAVGRHHGLPTRLLDWSESALTAAWFATEGVPRDIKKNAAIWEIRTSKSMIPRERMSLADLDDHTTSPTLFKLFPRHVSPRLVAQSGAFTVHALPDGNSQFQNLEDRARAGDGAFALRKFFLPKDSLIGIRKQLSAIGVSPASLYPDLNGIADTVKWQFDLSLIMENIMEFPRW